MLKKIKYIFIKFVMNRGINHDLPSGINLTIQFSNVSSFSLAWLIFPYIFIFQLQGIWLLGLLCIPMVVFYLSIPFINHKGYTTISRLLMTFMGHLIVLTYSIAFGKESGIYQLFIVTSFYSIMYFDKSERNKQLMSILLTFLSVSIFYYFVYFKKIIPIELTEKSYELISPLIFLTTLLLVLVFIFFYYFSRNRIVGELEDSLSHNEESLVKSRERFKLLFERTNDAIFLVDLKSLRYLDANSAAEQLTGRTVEDLKRHTTSDITLMDLLNARINFLRTRQIRILEKLYTVVPMVRNVLLIYPLSPCTITLFLVWQEM